MGTGVPPPPDGGGYVYPVCDAGKSLTAYSQMSYLGPGSIPQTYPHCRFRKECGENFPTVFSQTGCDGKETKGECGLSYLCCGPTDSIQCTGDVIYRDGNCLANEVKVYRASNDEGSYCRRNCTCVPPCTTTAPTGLGWTRTSDTAATISWTPGSGGASQRLYVGTNEIKVTGNCPNGTGAGTGCVAAVTGIASSTTSRSVTGLTANTVYYYKVVNYKSATCSSSSTVARNISSCTTPNISVNVGQSSVLTSNVKDSGEIANVRFARTGTTYTIAPVNSNGVTVDSAHPYTTTVRAKEANSPANF